eukprot:scaffold62667_cov20-Tisochrysis_lutea.AAC.1
MEASDIVGRWVALQQQQQQQWMHLEPASLSSKGRLFSFLPIMPLRHRPSVSWSSGYSLSPSAAVCTKEQISGKYESYCFNASLTQASDILEQWVALQRQWMYLEPIFSSEDIMQQLPLEAKRFATVDRIWRKTLESAKRNPLVLK